MAPWLLSACRTAQEGETTSSTRAVSSPDCFPAFLGSLQLDVQSTAHRLAEEGDARLRLLPVHACTANGVLDFLAHRLLDRIDGDGRCCLRLGFPVGSEDVFDHLVLKDENVLVPDVPRLIG